MDKHSIAEVSIRRRQLLAGTAIFLLGISPGSTYWGRTGIVR